MSLFGECQADVTSGLASCCSLPSCVVLQPQAERGLARFAMSDDRPLGGTLREIALNSWRFEIKHDVALRRILMTVTLNRTVFRGGESLLDWLGCFRMRCD